MGQQSECRGFSRCSTIIYQSINKPRYYFMCVRKKNKYCWGIHVRGSKKYRKHLLSSKSIKKKQLSLGHAFLITALMKSNLHKL
jgi:hypothetical protein